MSLALPRDLTSIQEAIWLDQRLFRGKPIYNTGQFLSIKGDLRPDLFERALRETIAESPDLSLPPRTGVPPVDLVTLDVRRKRNAHAAANQWMQEEMRRPISLEDPALFRFALLRVGDDHWLWFQKYHHIIIDATGRRLLSERTVRHYRALRFGEPLPARDAMAPQQLVAAERHYAASDACKADRAYWLEQFRQWPGPLLDINRQDTERAKSGCHARVAFTLKRADFQRLEAAARELRSSVFRVIIALTHVAFARLYDRYELALGLELANRSDARAKQAVGFFARPLPMLLSLDRSMTIADAVSRVEEIRAQNYPHRHFPVQEIARELDITRKGHHGLFDIIVNYVPIAYDFAFEDDAVEISNLSYGFTSPWTVTIADTGPAHDLAVTIDTDPGLISAELASRMAQCIETLLLRGMDDLACPIGALPIMPETAKAELLQLAGGETVALPDGATLATLCAAQAQRAPDAIAILSGEQHVSFVELHERADRLARRLSGLGVRPGVIVGVALPRTPDMVVAVLAVHKAGGAYLALDPAYPAERIKFIIADAAAPIILTNEALAPTFASSGARLVFDAAPADDEPGMADLIAPGPEDLAYVIYTSGSTGRPKAVAIEHRNVVNLIFWGRSVLTDEELHGVLCSTSLNFDLSVFEIFLPLAFGGRFILAENLLTLQSTGHREKVRFVNSSPSMLEALVRAGGVPPGVTTILLAGERLSRHQASAIFRAAPRVRLLNCYGPTETTVYTNGAPVDSMDTAEPSLGRAMWNTSLYILDGGLALLPRGIEGELYIGGANVGRGYLGRDALTAERFLPNPFGPGRIYRSGDRVRWRADGALDFVGRTDNQLKINGIRVEPGEIEAALLALPGIAAAAVTLHEEPGGARRLTAYLVGSADAPATKDVRAALERELPRNMVPTFFVWLDTLPLTPNGKLDHKALPPPPREQIRPLADHAPQSKLERELADIWQDLLQVPEIGVHSDFFDIGGDSLALVSLFAAIDARYGRNLTVDILSGGLTIAGLAQILDRDPPPQDDLDPVVALQPRGHLPPFFCAHGIGGDVLHLHRLAVHMGPDRPVFGLRRTTEAHLTDGLEQMAARYVDAMLTHQPSGPFYIGGHSFGAMIAYEMARQLVEQGHEIGLLAIIDQRRPGWRLTARNAIPALPRILANIPRRLRDELAEIPPADRLREIRRLMQRWSRAAFGMGRSATTMFDLSHADPEQIQLFDAHIRALRAYRPKPLSSVPITLFRAKTQLLAHLAMDRTLGWSEFAKRDVQVRVVPGSHGSITTEPLVQHLAQTLTDELDTAQGVSRGVGMSAK